MAIGLIFIPIINKIKYIGFFINSSFKTISLLPIALIDCKLIFPIKPIPDETANNCKKGIACFHFPSIRHLPVVLQ